MGPRLRGAQLRKCPQWRAQNLENTLLSLVFNSVHTLYVRKTFSFIFMTKPILSIILRAQKISDFFFAFFIKFHFVNIACFSEVFFKPRPRICLTPIRRDQTKKNAPPPAKKIRHFLHFFYNNCFPSPGPFVQ